MDPRIRPELMDRLAKAGWVFHGEGPQGRQEWIYPGLPRLWTLRQAVLIEFDMDIANPLRKAGEDVFFRE